MDLTPLLADRLVLVTGKGGTGKTTFAAAIAALQAAKGRRTLLCEVDSQRPSLDPIVGRPVGFTPVRMGDKLDAANLVWPETLVAYLKRMVGMERIVRAILGNEMVQRFLDFVPGSQELVTLSAIAEQVERYDCVVVDLPASGHAFSLLDITRSALGLFRAGPVRERVLQLRTLLEDRGTRVLVVALPEEMVVNETLETLGRLREHGLLGAEPMVVLNRAIPPSLTDDERTLLDRLSAEGLGGDAGEFLEAGRWERVSEEAVAEAAFRLTDRLKQPPVLVPLAPAAGTERDAVRHVAVQLGRHLGVGKQELAWI